MPDPRPLIASVFLSPACDMACRFCAAETDFSVMSFAQATGLLDTLRTRGIDRVVLGGGEPFLWPHGVLRLGAEAKARGFHVQVCTNGLQLTPEAAESPGADRYILPLESMDPPLHDSLRVAAGGHHALVLDKLRLLRDAGREVTISTVITSRNLAGLDGVADHLAREGEAGLAVHAWHLYRFLPVGRGGTPNGSELAVAPEAYRAACARMKARDMPFLVYRRDDMLHSSRVLFFWFEGERLRSSG